MTIPEPEFISSEEYVDPGDRINAMFNQSFAGMRDEATGDQEEADQEDEESEE